MNIKYCLDIKPVITFYTSDGQLKFLNFGTCVQHIKISILSLKSKQVP